MTARIDLLRHLAREAGLPVGEETTEAEIRRMVEACAAVTRRRKELEACPTTTEDGRPPTRRG